MTLCLEKLRPNMGIKDPKYDPKFCPVVIKMMSDGASIAEVCKTLKICLSSFTRYEKKHEEFGLAAGRGREVSKAWWLEQGRINLYNKQFNTALWYINKFRE